MNNRHDSILGTVGGTPVIRINKLAPKGINLYVKAEAFNPMGSVKDRLALGVIESAEQSGALKPGQTVIEATSGNTGIGLAMVCAVKGYPLVVTMAENFSVERRRMMRFLGAKVVLTPASEMGTGMLAKAVELAETHGWFLCHQFENEANADMHSRTTAPEILQAFADIRLDYWVSGYGTGGTLKGVARVLKSESPNTVIAVCEADNSPVLRSGVAQKRNTDGTPAESHPSFRPHLLQGWGPDFIPKLVGDVVDDRLFDELVPIKGADALHYAKELAQKEGIFTGITGGGTFAGAVQVAQKAKAGANILCMLPDTGERYLTTQLFEDIPVEMTAAEIEISKSTPRFRFDEAPAVADDDDTGDEPIEVTPEAVAFVQEVTASTDQPVVLFALEWCEFCWSVRKLFARLGIEYRSVDLDSADYQADDWGGKVRAALIQKTNFVTIPQLFVGGEFVGGATDAFDDFKSGKLQALLERKGVAFNKADQFDPYELLPTWLHPR
jgi:cysteine synthase A